MALFSPEISTKEMVPLCRQIATAYDAGIPVVKSLEMAADNASSRKAQQVFRRMSEDCRGGSTLSDAVRMHEKHLPRFFIEVLASGERGGRLDVMLRDLAQFFEDRQRISRSVVGAMTTPILQIIAAWFLGTFALGLISRIDLEAREPFNFMEYLRDYFIFQGIVLGGVAVVILVLWVLGKTGAIGSMWGWFSTHVWPFKNMTRKFALARFFRSMSLLIESGIDIRHCIISSAETTTNSYVKKDLLKAVPLVNQGVSLSEAFSGSRTLTPVAHEMLFVGEQSGRLDESLRKVSEYEFEEGMAATDRAVKILRVALTLAVGLLVGFIVISFYSRYLGMFDSLGI
jgi:type IV pilus assembly protein PilC